MNREQAVEIIERHIDNNIASGSLVEQALSMAIDALKAQLSSEDATSDLISRTETVEHLRRVLDVTVPITDYDSGYVDGVEFGVSTVSTMPTVQPQSTVGQLNDGVQSTDLIDRQAVIDELRKFKPEIIPYEKARIYVEETVETMYDRIVELPSIQPERKKGEWLPDNNNAYEMRFVCSCCKESEVVPTIGFTKYKPLWDFFPNCGADMRGEKDG